MRLWCAPPERGTANGVIQSNILEAPGHFVAYIKLALMAKTQSRQPFRRSQRRIATGFDRIVLYEFDILEQHREFVERHFTKTIADFEKKFDEDITGWDDPSDREAYGEHLAEEYHRLSNDLPRLQWYAQFLVAFATFENSLHELCRIVQRRSILKLGVKDLSGQGIVRASAYLRKLVGVEAPFETSEWNRALLFSEIRNAIAHRTGSLELKVNDPKSLASRIQKLEGVELIEPFVGAVEGEILLKPEFLKQAIRDMRKVLSDVANYELYDDES
jgi:hypothetical protein